MIKLSYRFVDVIPENLEPQCVYISLEYSTAIHLCCCGCGREVVTPISPKDWHVTFDGASVSLHPSIGNWKFPCRSHYWIRKSNVVWAPAIIRESFWRRLKRKLFGKIEWKRR